jgi:hypothetical protein
MMHATMVALNHILVAIDRRHCSILLARDTSRIRPNDDVDRCEHDDDQQYFRHAALFPNTVDRW